MLRHGIQVRRISERQAITAALGAGSVIGPNSRLTNATVGNGCTVDETVIVDSAIDDDVCCGPRAYLRGHQIVAGQPLNEVMI